MPIKTAVMIPFLPLPEFAAHEKQLLPGIRIHPGVEHPEVSELLPWITRHLVEERALAVNDLVMTEHQDEVFLEGIEQLKGDIALVILPVNGFPAHVDQEIVHPTHVPFEPEPESSEISWT